MARKPYQSALIPYEDEIIALRHRRPPTSYARIAELLLQKYKLSICRETIFRFVKVRSRVEKCIASSGTPPQRRPNPLGRRHSLPILAPLRRRSLNSNSSTVNAITCI